MMINVNIDIPLAEIQAFCEKYPIRKLSLFGSVITDHFRPDSDIDVLVEFEPDAKISYFDLAGMKFELQDVLGREVDLLTPGALSKYFRAKVQNMAVTIYERE